MGDVVELFGPLWCSNCHEEHREWSATDESNEIMCRRCYDRRPRHIEVNPIITEEDWGHSLGWLCPVCGCKDGMDFKGDDTEGNATYFKNLVEAGEYDPTCPDCTSGSG